MRRNNEHQLGGGGGGESSRRRRDATELKKKAILAHKRIWHPHSQSCCAGAIMKSPPLSLPSPPKFLLGSGRGASQQRRMRSLTSWRTLWPGLLVAFLMVLGSVGGTEDWTIQCPTGCKCTWVSGKKTADCRGSHWTSIPSGLSAEVQVLEMGGITIKYLPKDAFKQVGLVNLQKVFLQNCRIERIDRDAFRDLTIMIELDLSGNLVSGIEMETFESNVRLRELKLSKNPLTKLTGSSFPPLMYLKLLDLSDCQLSTLPKKAFEKLSVLESLSLSGNRFTYLSKELFKPLTKLKSLQLAGNPWKCDCRLKTLRDWVIQNKLFQHHTQCAEPAIVSKFAWDHLASLDFSCRPEIVSVQINGKPTDALLVHTDIGSDITLQCLVRGNPPPDLKWVRDGQVLTNNSRSYGKSYYLHIGGEEGWELEDPYSSMDDYRGRWVNLTIQKTDPEDAGEYTCVGSNSGGVVEKNLTLNFQDVPSGAGVGHGLGGLAGGAYRDTGWIWILITTLAVLVFATTLITLVCFCSRRRRVKTTRAQDLKGEDQPNQRQLLLTPSSRSPGSGKVDEDGTTMLLMKEKYLVGPDARSQSVDIITSSPYPENGSVYRPSSAQMIVPPPPSHALTGGPHGGGPSSEYPDLLDLPHTRFQESPAPSTVSTLPDSTRMLITPQQLNPSIVVNPSRLGYNHPQAIYSNGGRPSFGLPFSPAEQPAFVPAGMRPGYVTLPRRHRVPSWSPGPSSNFDPTSSPMGPPSPTGSAATISLPFVKARPKYDNLGPRTTADGSSRLSLNNLPDNGTPNTPNSFHHPHPGLMGGTLGRHNVLRSTPTPSILGQPISHFAPIQEVEPISSPADVDNDVFVDEDSNTPTARPSSSDKQNPSSKTEKTRTPTPSGSSRGSSPTKPKKVPPKPPPKPTKKNNANPTTGTGDSSISNGPTEKINDPSTAIAGDDGTEV